MSPPTNGQVIGYEYLWARQAQQGQRVGEKVRAVVVVAHFPRAGHTFADVVPITRDQPPAGERFQLRPRALHRLALSSEPHWLKVSEFNRFIWPFDVWPMTNAGRTVGGCIDQTLFQDVTQRMVTLYTANRLIMIDREALQT